MGEDTVSDKGKEQGRSSFSLQGLAAVITAIGGLSGLIAVLHKSPEPPNPVPTPSPSIVSPLTPNTQPPTAQSLYDEAIKLGKQASTLSAKGRNNTLSSNEWEKIGKLWQKAIGILEAIPLEDPIYTAEKVDKKIDDYKENETYANQAELAAPWLQAIRLAERAGVLTQNAQTSDDWIRISGSWQQAIELMQSVPDSYVRYNEVGSKISEYQSKLKYSQQQQSKS